MNLFGAINRENNRLAGKGVGRLYGISIKVLLYEDLVGVVTSAHRSRIRILRIFFSVEKKKLSKKIVILQIIDV